MSSEYEAYCNDCDWAEQSDERLGAYFAGRDHHTNTTPNHDVQLREVSLDGQ